MLASMLVGPPYVTVALRFEENLRAKQGKMSALLEAKQVSSKLLSRIAATRRGAANCDWCPNGCQRRVMVACLLLTIESHFAASTRRREAVT